MQYILSENRQQVEFSSLEELIEKDKPVSFVDAFVEHIEISELGFVTNKLFST